MGRGVDARNAFQEGPRRQCAVTQWAATTHLQPWCQGTGQPPTKLRDHQVQSFSDAAADSGLRTVCRARGR